jgi:hypothetical protein
MTRSRRLFIITLCVAVSLVTAVGTGAFAYYQSLKRQPAYSLALLIDAAKRDDKAAIEELIDYDAVVDDFTVQVIDKAIELYGRGLPQDTLRKAAALSRPLLPAVKERARSEVPRVIRERTGQFGNVPFFGLVFGADRYLETLNTGNSAIVRSKLDDRPLEVRMRRTGDRWQITGIRDEDLAQKVAAAIGQEIIAIATKGGEAAAERFGLGDLSEIIKQAERLLR